MPVLLAGNRIPGFIISMQGIYIDPECIHSIKE